MNRQPGPIAKPPGYTDDQYKHRLLADSIARALGSKEAADQYLKDLDAWRKAWDRLPLVITPW